MSKLAHPVLSAERFIIVQYVWVAPMALWLFEYCTMLGDEVEFVWNAKLTRVKLLFLVCRYTPLLEFPFAFATRFGPISISDNTCRFILWVRVLLIGITILSTEAILLLRTFSICTPSKKTKLALLVYYTVSMIISAVAIFIFTSTINFIPQPLPMLEGCYRNNDDHSWLESVYSFTWVTFESVLMSLNACAWLKKYKIYGHPLPKIILQGGAIHFLAILGITVSAALIIAFLPREFADICETLQIVVISVIAARIHIQLRRELASAGRVSMQYDAYERYRHSTIV